MQKRLLLLLTLLSSPCLRWRFRYLTLLQKHGKPDAVFTDVGSVKSHVLASLADHEASLTARFVPGHPIAGSEKSGYVSAKSGLFEGRRVILTPHEDNTASAVAEIHLMWRALGAEVLGMGPERHDEVLAATSHLLTCWPIQSLICYFIRMPAKRCFVMRQGDLPISAELLQAMQMWSDIAVANADATAAILTQYIEYLEDLKLLVARRQGQDLKFLFQRAKDTRDNFIVHQQDLSRATAMTNDAKSYRLRPGGSISGAPGSGG